MLLPLIASLLAHLSTAAPVPGDPALSPILAKRSIECDANFGHNIALGDCYEVLRNMRKLPQFKDDSGEGIFAQASGTFSRNAVDSRFRLPQSFTTRTCTIFVDLSSTLNELVIMRSSVLVGAQRINNQCVRLQYIGGTDITNGIATAIGNEQFLHHSLRPGWEVCKALANDTPFDQQAQCLLHELEVVAEAAVAAERATGPSNHGTSKR